MRRVFENSVKAAHSTSIARPCDGGVSELFRSCFCALAMFSRQRRENIASVPAGLLALWAKRTASRFASLTLRTSPRAGAARPGFRPAYFRPAGSKRTCSRFASLTLRTSPRAGYARPGFRPAYFRPLGSKRTASRSAKADPPNCAPCGRGPPGVPHGLFSPCGLKTHGLQVRFAHPPNCALCGQSPPRVPAGLLALGPNARPPGPLKRTLRTSPRAGVARPGFRPAYFRPAGSKRACSRSAKADPPNCAPCRRGPPGVPAGLLARWAKRTASRSAGADPPNFASRGCGPPGGSGRLPGSHRVDAASCPARMLKTGRNVVY